MLPADNDITSAKTIRIGFVGPGMSGCDTAFHYVLRACSGLERAPNAAGECEYASGQQRARLELIICRQRPILSERGPASVAELARVDGIIFVADSQKLRLEHNKGHLLVLRKDLKQFGVDVDELSVVFALNKADLPPAGLASTDKLTSMLRTRRCAHVVTSATTGAGILASIDKLLELIDAR